MICKKCKFANWLRTESGRLSPTGQGKCEWQKTIRVAGSTRYNFGKPFTVQGGYIWRKKGEEFPTSCDVFQPIEAAQ